MITADIHTHTTFSPDGRSSIEEMIARAQERKLEIYGISEHFNYDYDRMDLRIDGQAVPPIDEEAYFTRARALQRQYAGTLQILIGAEFGYDHDSRSLTRYCRTAEKYKPDFIINSIHTCLGMDCYFPPLLRRAEQSLCLQRIPVPRTRKFGRTIPLRHRGAYRLLFAQTRPTPTPNCAMLTFRM